LLRAIIRDGIADCGAFQFPSTQADSSALFSLRPEAISLASHVSQSQQNSPKLSDSVHFTATIHQQIYSGATELLELETATGTILRARISSRAPISGSHEFTFSAQDAIPVHD
jgi:hypothetical protein